MRRPVKPFVTEYRGSSRRAKDGSSPPMRDMSEDDLQRKSIFAANGRHDIGDNSYEAALKAADALFSPQTSHSPRADRLVTAKGASSEPAQAIDPVPQTAILPQHLAGRVDGKPTGGRILQAIEKEEPVSVGHIAPERPLARRGRKPGSKNKPKPTAPSSFVGSKPAKPGDVKVLPVKVNDVGLRATKPAVSPAPAGKGATSAVSMTKTAPRPAGRKRIDRFAWVRTRLKPGENWKRRLPKVLW